MHAGAPVRARLASPGHRLSPKQAIALALAVRLALLAAAGCALGLLVHGLAGRGGHTSLDRLLVRAVAEHRSAWLTTAMRVLTWLGSTTVLVPLVVGIGLVARRRTGSWASLATLGLSLGGAIVLYDFVKPVVGRPRPHTGRLVETITGYSFPSGHSTQMAAVTVTLALLTSAMTGSRRRRVTAWSIAVVASLVVAFSRVYLGVHWPTDVVAALALGAAWAGLSFATTRGCRAASAESESGSVRR